VSDTPRCEHEIMEVHYAARHLDENEKGAFEFCVGYDFARQLERELSAMTKERDEWKESAEAAGRQWCEQAGKLTERRRQAEQAASDASHLAGSLLARAEAAEALNALCLAAINNALNYWYPTKPDASEDERNARHVRLFQFRDRLAKQLKAHAPAAADAGKGKQCDEPDCGTVALYVDGVTGAVTGWFCRECGKPFTQAEVEALEGEYDAVSLQRMGQRESLPRGEG
jgi:hypothetical protein